MDLGEKTAISVSVENHRNLILSVWMFGVHGLDLDLPPLQSLCKMKTMICVCFLWAVKARKISVQNILKDAAVF